MHVLLLTDTWTVSSLSLPRTPRLRASLYGVSYWTYGFIPPATALLAKGSVQFSKHFLRTYYVSGPALEVRDPSLGGGLGL